MGRYFKCEKDCPDRKPACHGTCQKYKDDSAEWEKAKAYVRAANDFDNYKAQLVLSKKEKERRRHKKR